MNELHENSNQCPVSYRLRVLHSGALLNKKIRALKVLASKNGHKHILRSLRSIELSLMNFGQSEIANGQV